MTEIEQFLTAFEEWFLSDNEIMDTTPSTNEQ